MANTKRTIEDITETYDAEKVEAKSNVREKKSTVSTTKVIDCERLRIRKSPMGDEITTVEVNTTMKAKKIDDPEWLAVELEDGTRGYAMARYLEFI